MSFVARVIVYLIRFYQVGLAPLLGPCCRFVPSCSHFTLEAIASKGVSRGLKLGLKRIFRCHPFHRGGLDLIR